MSLYKPNSQDAQQFAINGIQRATINLFGKDFTGGQNFPEFEGDWFYVEQTDFPVLLSFMTPGSNARNSIVAQPGVTVKMPFKGFFITCPTLNNVLGFPKISIVIGKKGSEFFNERENARNSFLPPYLTVSDTGIALDVRFYVPAGTRYMPYLQFSFAATTVTSAVWRIYDKSGNQITGPLINDLETNINFSNLTLLEGDFENQAIVNGRAILSARDIAVPHDARYLQLACVGTGMSFANPRSRIISQ